MLFHPYRTSVKWGGIISTFITGQKGSFLNSIRPLVPLYPLPACYFSCTNPPYTLLAFQSSPHWSLDSIPHLSVALSFPAAFLISESPSDYGGQRPNQNDCGTWIRNINGGSFTSPNYPNPYPPNKECVYILEGKARSLMFHLLLHSTRTADTVSRLSACCLLQWMSLAWLALFYITSLLSDFLFFC